jgi:two-component system response regulator GlrR
MEKILVVDDDSNILEVIQMRLEAEGFEVIKALDTKQALDRANHTEIDLALIDLKLKNEDGISLMGKLHQYARDIPVIILTAHGSIDNAVEAMKKGASSYLTKPFDHQELLLQLNNCLEKSRLAKEVSNLRSICDANLGVRNIIGISSGIKQVLKQVKRAAGTDSNVHIEGESGTGKELIAKSLHLDSRRRNEHFVAINCAAIPETLLESELFGYKKGAFTGANMDKKGLLAQAHQGSFFLDEISEMPLSMQAKLLRIIEEREFYPLGANKTVRVDIRIITASHQDLEDEVEKGNFREDLYYRIHVIPIKLPPLRERKEDIPLLVRHFLNKYSEIMQKKVTHFSKSALQRLLAYTWPGNVRELENTVESAVALAENEVIGEETLLPKFGLDTKNIKPLKEARDDFMKDYLLHLIEYTNGNVSRAAKLAGKHRADLYELFKRYELEPDNYRK